MRWLILYHLQWKHFPIIYHICNNTSVYVLTCSMCMHLHVHTTPWNGLKNQTIISLSSSLLPAKRSAYSRWSFLVLCQSTVVHIAETFLLLQTQPAWECENVCHLWHARGDTYMYMCVHIHAWSHVRCERKKEARQQTTKQGKATRHLRQCKKKLPQVGLEPTTLLSLDRMLYQLSYKGSPGRAKITHLMVPHIPYLHNLLHWHNWGVQNEFSWGICHEDTHE